MFTNEQAEMLGRLENGMVWVWFQSEREDAILHYLMDKGLCTSREDIAPGQMALTEAGCAALAGLRKQHAEQTKHEREKERAEAVRLKERQQDHADEERRYRTQNKIAIIMPLVTFALGMLVEYFYGVLRFIFSVFHG